MPRARFATPQHTEVGTAAVQLVAADANRSITTVQNTGNGVLFLGQSAVTALTGLGLDPGKTCTVVTSLPVFGISASGAPAHAVVTETLQS